MDIDFSYLLVILFMYLIFRVLINRFSKASSVHRVGRVLVKREEAPDKGELLQYIYNTMVKSKLYNSVNITGDENGITANTKATMRSWGEDVVLKVVDTAEGVEVFLESSSAVKTTQFDWGKNDENIRVLSKLIESSKREF